MGAYLDPTLTKYYPDYKPARTDSVILTVYIFTTLLYMVAWESFFRGFLLFGMARVAGPLFAILFQVMPFYILHRGGPASELVSSFFGGVILAAFCYRAKSFIPAVILHGVLNTTMQILGFVW